MTKACASRNRIRLFNASYKDQDPVKKRRKVLRVNSKKKGDTHEHKEGTLYEAGAF